MLWLGGTFSAAYLSQYAEYVVSDSGTFSVGLHSELFFAKCLY